MPLKHMHSIRSFCSSVEHLWKQKSKANRSSPSSKFPGGRLAIKKSALVTNGDERNKAREDVDIF